MTDTKKIVGVRNLIGTLLLKGTNPEVCVTNFDYSPQNTSRFKKSVHFAMANPTK